MSDTTFEKTSLAKVQANQQNALKSKGPMTSEGKNISKWNALKHGILSKEIIICKSSIKEDKESFQSLLSSLEENLKPVGIIEEILVERIVVAYWRLRRVVWYEKGVLWHQLNKYAHETNREEFNDEYGHISCFSTLKLEIEGLERLYSWVNELLTWNENKIKRNLNSISSLSPLCPDKADATAVQGKWKDCILKWKKTKNKNVFKKMLPIIKTEIHVKEKERDEAREKIDMGKETQISKLFMMPNDETEKVMKYERFLEKQIYRALDELERLQRRRKGEFTPSPFNINLNTES